MKKLLVVLVVAVLSAAVPVHSQDAHNRGYAFYGIGTSSNFSGGMVDVRQPILPQVTLEWGYPIGNRLAAGFEISTLFYRNRTQKWGGEFGFGASLGGVVALNISKRWFVTTGGGWALSNPLSDNASGEYGEGYEGNPAARIVREPIQRRYVRFTIGRRFGEHWGVQAGTRNLSPYVAIGFAPQ